MSLMEMICFIVHEYGQTGRLEFQLAVQKKLLLSRNAKKKKKYIQIQPWWITFMQTVDSLGNNGWCTVTQRSCFWSQCHFIYWCSLLRNTIKRGTVVRGRGKFTKPQQQFFSDLAQKTKQKKRVIILNILFAKYHKSVLHLQWPFWLCFICGS